MLSKGKNCTCLRAIGIFLTNAHRIAVLVAMALIPVVAAAANSDKEDFDWKEAAREVENLPFTRTFIDSIYKINTVTPHVESLRKIDKKAFSHGETLVYEIAWGPFKAGYVVLTTEPDLKNNTLRLGGKALSNNFVSAFYRMRDFVLSTVDADGMYPLFFEQHLREGKKYVADGWIAYDHHAGKMHVNNKRKLRTFDTPPFVHDYLSILYHVRSMKHVPGDTFSLQLFIHSKVHPLLFRCGARKAIEVEAGTFNCLLIEPRLVGEGRAFNKKDKMEVFLSDDDLRMPVLIKSKIKFGSVTARLVWHNRTASPPNLRQD